MSDTRLNKLFYKSIKVAKELNGYVLKQAKPSQEGYYNVPFIQLDTKFRGQGEGLYDPITLSQHLLDPSVGMLAKSILEGGCYGEYRHPKRNNRPMNEWVERCFFIDSTLVSHYIREINPGKEINNKKTLYLNFKPFGPYGDYLRQSLEDPYMNTAFSIRTFVGKQDPKTGYLPVRAAKTIDHCDIPGFEVASKRFQMIENDATTIMNNMFPEVDPLKEEYDITLTLAEMIYDNNRNIRMHSNIIDDIKKILLDESFSYSDAISFIDKRKKQIVSSKGKRLSLFDILYKGENN
jgi:hypothetical protein